MAQTEARKTKNLNHKHLDILFQNENVPEAYARERDSPFGCVLTGSLCCTGGPTTSGNGDGSASAYHLPSSVPGPGDKKMHKSKRDKQINI